MIYPTFSELTKDQFTDISLPLLRLSARASSPTSTSSSARTQKNP